MSELDPFSLNILGAEDLVNTEVNKIQENPTNDDGGVSGNKIDELTLEEDDTELIKLAKEWSEKSSEYTAKIASRQKMNKSYLFGTQENSSSGKRAPSNFMFQATATFVPQALAKNPEPTVWSDNTPEGKEASNDIKTMLQYHADVLCMRKKLGVMVWDWSVYLIGVWKYGWDAEVGDISLSVRKPSDFILDPDGYVDEFGDYHGLFLGEKISGSLGDVVDMYPDKKTEILEKNGLNMGTQCVRIEWWTNENMFVQLGDIILEKSRNPFFKYEEGKINHFAIPKMPYSMLSVFSLQEQPHDFTNLVEQNIANQDSIIERERLVTKNLRHGNNSIILDDAHFDKSTGHEAAMAIENGDPILGPKDSVQRLPANNLPGGLLESLESDKQKLLTIYGTEGVTAQEPNRETTARGMILNQSFDNTRIGGGVGDSLEQLADNAFNWFLQLYYVFYDEAHYASIMGRGRAIEYVKLTMTDSDRRFVVSVTPNSMKPKDELSEQNLAMQRWQNKAIDPINLMRAMNEPDPLEAAKQLVLWVTNPQLYLSTYFPEQAQIPDSANPGINGPEPSPQQPNEPSTLSEEPASAALSQVKLPQ